MDGVSGAKSAQELAEDYLVGQGPLDEKVDSLIRWQTTKAGAAGFVTGIGGILAMPVTLPANITTVLYIQTCMIAAIAYMGGYDVNTDRVRTLVYCCLVGDAARQLPKRGGWKLERG